jgi:hypothetical protein
MDFLPAPLFDCMKIRIVPLVLLYLYCFYFDHYLVNFGLLKSLELVNDHLEFQKLNFFLYLGATVCHMMQQ